MKLHLISLQQDYEEVDTMVILREMNSAYDARIYTKEFS